MKYVTFLESESEFVQWLKISKILVGTDEDVYFGIVYIPPENSKYCNNNDLNMFYAELELYNNNNKHVAMMGDFNARTSNKLDVAISDERIFEALDLDVNFVNDGDVCAEISRNNNFSLVRDSQDKITNRFGNILTDFCKANNLVILNGRCFKDLEKGNFTCREKSVVDYVIFSSKFIHTLVDFNVDVFDPLLSDVHCTLSFDIFHTKDNSHNNHRDNTEKINMLIHM